MHPMDIIKSKISTIPMFILIIIIISKSFLRSMFTETIKGTTNQESLSSIKEIMIKGLSEITQVVVGFNR
jgi:hypothetical protein